MPSDAPAHPAHARLLRLGVMSALVVVGMIAVYRAAMGSSDLDAFYRAGRVVWELGILLDDKGVERYPPTFQVLMAPLGALPMWASAAVWTALNVAAVMALPRLMERLSGVSVERQLPAWLAMAPFVINNILLCQSGLILLYLVALGLRAAQRGRSVAGGAAVGLAAALKIIPIAFLAVPIVLRRAGGAVAGAVLVLVAALGLTAAVLGSATMVESLIEWRRESREQTPWSLVERGQSLRFNNQGLAVTIARTIGRMPPHPSPRVTKGAVRLAELPLTVAWVSYFTIAAAVGAAWLAVAWRCRRLDTPRVWTGLFALSAIVMLVASPLVWTHYFIWLLPALVFLADRPRLVLGVAAASLLVLAVTPLRGLGGHMVLSLVLYAIVAREMWRGVSVEAGARDAEAAAVPA